VDASFF
jgi:hypothetical protein